MGIFGDLTYSKTRPMDAGLPVEDVKQLNQSLDKSYWENRNKIDAVEVALAQLDLESIDDPVKLNSMQIKVIMNEQPM